MKLLVILSVIAFGYADKLDRTYLPPASAATAGGSPGALSAPIQPGSSFLQAPLGSQQGNFGFPQAGPSSFKQEPSGIPSSANNFVSPNNGASDGNAFGFSKNGAAPSTSYGPASQAGPSSPTVFASSQIGSQNGNVQAPGSFIQGESGQDVAQSYRPERPQAAADRNAEILKYINENNIESYNYSYETSNGISAEETGEAANGVRAQGGYSYTGDDGQSYSITYTADENGYQPQGEHLPTPHPIPEEILKSIEENARAAAAGTQEGAYRPEEYESEAPQQQYSSETSGFNRPVGQTFGSTQGFQAKPDQAINQPQDNQYSTSQGESVQAFVGGQSDRTGQGLSGSFSGNSPAGPANQASSGLFKGNTLSGSANQASLGLSSGNAQSGPVYQGTSGPSGSFNGNGQSGPSYQGSSGSFNGNAQSGPAEQGSSRSFNGYAQSRPSYQGSSGQFNGNTLSGPAKGSSGSFNGNAQSGPSYQGSSGPFNGNGLSGPAQGSSGSYNTQSGFDYNQSNQGQSQGADGYKYNRPQNVFGSAGPNTGSFAQNGQGQTGFLGSSSSPSTPNRYQSTSGSSSSNVPSSTFGIQTQNQVGLAQSNIQSGSQVSGQGSPFNQGQNGQASYQQFGSSGSAGQGNKYQSSAAQNTFGINQGTGNQGGSSIGQGNQKQNGNMQPFGSNIGAGSIASQGASFTGQGYQSQYNNRQPFGSSIGSGITNAGQGSTFNSQGNQNQYGNRQPFGSNIGSGAGQGAESQNAQTGFENRPVFGTNVQGPSQAGSSSNGSKGPQTLQAPYQYTRPGQTFGNQQQNSGSVGSNGSNGSQGTEQFGGPRQPPSYSPEEGYKY